MISLARNQLYALCTFALLQCLSGSASDSSGGPPLVHELKEYYESFNPKTEYSPINHRRRSMQHGPEMESDAPPESTYENHRGNADAEVGFVEDVYGMGPGKKNKYPDKHIYDNVYIATDNRSSFSAPARPPKKASRRGPIYTGNNSVSVNSVTKEPVYADLDFSQMKRHKGVLNLDEESSMPSYNPKQYNASLSHTSTTDSRRHSLNTLDSLDYPYNYENSVLSYYSDAETDAGPRVYDEPPYTRSSRIIKNARDSVKSNKKSSEGPPAKPKRTYEHEVKNKKTDMFSRKNYTQEGADVVEMSVRDARIPQRKRDRFLKIFKRKTNEPVQQSYEDRSPAIEPYVEDYPYDFPNHHFRYSAQSTGKRSSYASDKVRSPTQSFAYDEVDGRMRSEGKREKFKQFLKIRQNSSDSDYSNA